MKKTNAKLTLLADIDTASAIVQTCSRKSRLLRSTQKIGQKTELTAAIGHECQGSANEGLWREVA